MAIHNIDFSQYARQVAQEIFIKETVHRRPFYINSVAWQRRKSLRAHNGPKYLGQRGFVYQDPDVEKFLNFLHIGPYELKMLRQILSCKEGYLFIQGGSRSGKSSLMSFLKYFCDTIIEENNKDIRGELSSKLNLDTNSGTIKLLKIDVGGFSAIFTEESDPSYEMLCEKLIEFFRKVAEMIVYECENVFGNEFTYEDSFYYLCTGGMQERLPINTFTMVIKSLKSLVKVPSRNEWEKYTSVEKQTFVSVAIRDINLKMPGEILIAALAPIWNIIKNKELNQQNIKAIALIIDNIDPQPTYFQQKIAEEIRIVCSCKTWKDIGNRKINIVLPVRLSTFKRRISQHGHFESIEHEAFYPSDILSYRIQYFFLTNGSKTSYPSIPAEYQRAILLRLYSLWSHLSDRSSYFRRMIDALSGTNINHANGFAQNWCVCTNFPFGKFNYPGFPDVFFEKFYEDAADSLMNEFWLSFYRAIKGSLQDVSKEISDDLKSTQEFAISLGEKFCISLGDVFRDHRILCYPDSIETIGTRRKIAQKLSIKLKESVQNYASNQNSENFKQRTIHELKYLLKNLLSDGLLNEYFLKEFVNNVNYNLLVSLKTQCCEYIGFDEKLAKNLEGWLKSILNASISDMDSIRQAERPIYYLSDESTPYSKFLSSIAPSISRFEAGWHLLQPKGLQRHEILEPLNILGNDLKPIGLQILYNLYHSSDYGLEIAKLIANMSIYGYDREEDVLKTMKQMVRIDRRLIFCEVNDYEYGMSKIIQEPNMVVYLSNAGKGYIKNLVIAPPFLQWCLKYENSEKKSDKLETKVEFVFQTLKKMIDFELDKLKSFKNCLGGDKDFRTVGPEYYSCVFDVFVRAIDNYLPGLIAHFKNLSIGTQRSDDTIQLINRLVESSKIYFDKIIDLYNIDRRAASDDNIFQKWETSIGWSQKLVSDSLKDHAENR